MALVLLAFGVADDIERIGHMGDLGHHGAEEGSAGPERSKVALSIPVQNSRPGQNAQIPDAEGVVRPSSRGVRI
jgi:hypothetical protein